MGLGTKDPRIPNLDSRLALVLLHICSACIAAFGILELTED